MGGRAYAWMYAALFGGMGLTQPFLPAFLAHHGLTASEIALLLAAASLVKLPSGPLIGRLADHLGDIRRVLIIAALLAAALACGFGVLSGFLLLLAVQILHSLAAAPLVPLTDLLTLNAVRRPKSQSGGFDYGRVRSAGSIAFIATSVGGGALIGWLGLNALPWLFATTLLLLATAAWRLPAEPVVEGTKVRAGFWAPLALPRFRRLLPLSALIQGSHAVYYGFGAIHWGAAGISPLMIGLLWAEGVVAEVALFYWGRPLVERLGPRGLSILAACAGILRWSVAAETTWLPALFATQWLHAGTFGAQHLSAMRVLGRLPPASAATAQTLHAALGTGLASFCITLAAGPLFTWLGAGAFWAMAGLCFAALPLAIRFPRG